MRPEPTRYREVVLTSGHCELTSCKRLRAVRMLYFRADLNSGNHKQWLSLFADWERRRARW